MRRVQEAATAGKLAEQEADAERKWNQMKSFQLTTAEQNRRISEAAGEAAASNRSATKQRQDNQEWAQQAVEAERSRRLSEVKDARQAESNARVANQRRASLMMVG